MAELTLLRLPEVVRRTTLSRSEIYRRIADGKFPRQRKISPRKSVWHEEDVDRWIKENFGECAK